MPCHLLQADYGAFASSDLIPVSLLPLLPAKSRHQMGVNGICTSVLH